MTTGPNRNLTVFEFTEFGLARILDFVWDDIAGTWVEQSLVSYTYDQDNTLKEILLQGWNGSLLKTYYESSRIDSLKMTACRSLLKTGATANG